MGILVSILLFMNLAGELTVQSCQRLQEFDEITSVVTENFYDSSFRGLDWEGRVDAYRHRVECGDSPQAVAAIVNELLSALEASHTAVYTEEDLEYWALQSIFSGDIDGYPVSFSGIWPKREGDEWYAKYVLPGSSADSAGVLPGDQLMSINGEDFRPIGFPESKHSTLIVSSDGSTTRSVSVRPERQSLQRFFLEATRRSRRVFTVDDRSVGYVRLWAGTHELFLQELDAAISEYEEKRVDALVLDLRGGFGGANLDYLTTLRESAYLGRIPTYVLVDDGVRSGKEWMAAVIKEEALGTLVGSTTAGAFLGGALHPLADGTYLLYVAVAEFELPGIGTIEGVGVEPHVTVEPCRRFCSGRDPQLEKVLELVQEDRDVR